MDVRHFFGSIGIVKSSKDHRTRIFHFFVTVGIDCFFIECRRKRHLQHARQRHRSFYGIGLGKIGQIERAVYLCRYRRIIG